MPDGGERMMEDHSGARITHDGPDFLPHVGTVTMHRTLFTRRFFVTESTVFQAAVTVRSQCGTIRTKPFPIMLPSAE